MRLADVVKLVRHLKQELECEAGPVKQRATRALFDQWVDFSIKKEEQSSALDMLPLDLIGLEDEAQMQQVWSTMHSVPEVALHYLSQIVFPFTTKHQKLKLQASGVDLGSDLLFGTRLGFSG